MKKRVAIFLLFVFITTFAIAQQSMSSLAKKATKNKINTLLNDWHLAASEANFDDYFDKMDSVSVFIGTDATENWPKTAFAKFSKPYFDQGKAWDFKTLERNIYINSTGNFAWFDELLNTWMGTCRGSGVLEKKENVWVIKQYVLSVTIPNDDVQKVIAAKKDNDAAFLKKYN
ncbi:nuclear transport factor 2 family protein [Polaribacter sp. R77954]|uniref:nuclear transport factor 2 family protein n=1 Tax=Polaribacter sp. R77954 TaxID=3093870 RepID=UPI0037CACDC9